MRLHSAPPVFARIDPVILGTLGPPCGVRPYESGPALSVAGRVAVLLAMLSCLAFQGERCLVDSALRSPGSAIAAYWEALMNHDVEALWKCAAGPPEDLPFPGMQWGLPATRAFTIDQLRYVPIDENHVTVSYRVRFRPLESRKEQALSVTTDLVRIRGEYRVLNPLAEAGVMESLLQPLRVDI